MNSPTTITNEPRPCLVCGLVLPPELQQDHLAVIHPGPHVFYHDARRFETLKPSMMVVELKKLVRCSVVYLLHEERDGREIFYSDGQAVDLTREPHFFSVPPATYFRSIP
jgi:hypothetical protein